MISRRQFFQLSGGALSWPLAAGQQKRPNIIFILADDLGWGDLGCYGHPHVKTPHLDGMARDGVRFTQFYVNAPVCSASRAAFVTGNFPARHGIHGGIATPAINRQNGVPDALDPKVTTLPRLLRQAGYATAHYGKWHLGSGNQAPSPEAYGFDEHRPMLGNGPGWQWQKDDPYFWSRTTELFMDEGIRFIEKNRNRNFFLNLWTLIPHATLNPTERELEPYKKFGPPGVPHKGAHQIYFAAVTGLDAQIGRLLAKLDELGLAENTAIFFSSDNGPEDIEIYSANHSGVGSTGPFRGRKRSLYEGGVRVPLLVRWPGKAPAGRVDDRTVISAVDFLPTLAQMAGSLPPTEYRPDGEDMGAALAGRSVARRKPLMWEWRYDIYGHAVNRSPMLAIRDSDWKLLMNPDRSRVELYDIPRDPTELNNLAALKPEIVKRLSAPLLAWSRSLPPGPVRPSAGKNEFPGPTLAQP
jgi:N-acetylgalactosamine-6-sulfatase